MSLKYLSCPSKILASSITASATSFQLNNIKGWNGEDLTSADFGSQAFAVIRNANNTILELIEFDPTTIASSSITIVRRGLKFTGDLTTEVTANKLAWTKGDTFIDIGVDTPQMLQWLQEYIDAAIVAGGVPATTTVTGLTKMSVAPASASSPIAVGDNDPRVLTTAEVTDVQNVSVAGIISMYGGATAPTGWLLCDGSAVSRTTYADLFTAISTSYGTGDGSTTFNVPNLKSAMPVGYGQRTETFDFLDAAVNTSTDVITVPSNDWIQTGTALVLSTTGTLPTGLSATTYYAIRTAATTIKLATSVANANAGTQVDITAAAGGGTHTLTLTLTDRTLGAEGGEETHAISDAEMPSHTHVIQTDNNTGGGQFYVSENTDGGSSVASTAITNSAGSDTKHNNMPPYVTVNFIIKT